MVTSWGAPFSWYESCYQRQPITVFAEKQNNEHDEDSWDMEDEFVDYEDDDDEQDNEDNLV